MVVLVLVVAVVLLVVVVFALFFLVPLDFLKVRSLKALFPRSLLEFCKMSLGMSLESLPLEIPPLARKLPLGAVEVRAVSVVVAVRQVLLRDKEVLEGVLLSSMVFLLLLLPLSGEDDTPGDWTTSRLVLAA